jgi:hypothetical protein
VVKPSSALRLTGFLHVLQRRLHNLWKSGGLRLVHSLLLPCKSSYLAQSIGVNFTRNAANTKWLRTWNSLRHMEPLRWTLYLDDCVRILSKGQETELDILLTTQSKCHMIMDQITRLPTDLTADSHGSKAPPICLVKALQLQLQDIWRSLPATIEENCKSWATRICLP